MKKNTEKLQKKIDLLEENEKAIKKLFTNRQIQKLKNPNKRIMWSTEEITEAVALYSSGPRAYRLLLKKGYPFPAVATLKSWVKKIQLSPGILKNIFKTIKHDELSPSEKICVLSFDEMKLRSAYCYDKINDETLPAYNYAQVVMIRGLLGNWKQPIFFDYDCNLSKKILFDIIEYVESKGYYVSAIVSDLGPSNRSLHNELEVNFNKPFFTSPKTSHNIFVLADVPHMLKLIRNNFLDYGFVIDNKEITKSTIENILKLTEMSDLRITHKISEEHLTVAGTKRQKVKTAAKLFSHTVAQAINRCGQLGFMKEEDNWAECANFFKQVI